MTGVRFTCQPGCIACCDRPGRVYLTEDDIVRAAAFLGLDPREFEARYVYRTRRTIRLRQPPKRECHFLLSGGCAIHPAKPTQCRLFPFWPELVERPAEWVRTSRYCPGIGVGQLVQIGAAIELASEMKRAYPNGYPKTRAR